MRILVIGASGQVGWELVRALPRLGEVVSTARNEGADIVLDVCDLEQLERTLETVNPDVVVNAAAYTAVERAENEPELAMRINADTPRTAAGWAASNQARLVHYSTDYVFDGTKSEPYLENDDPAPRSAYGRSKLAGDEAILASGCAATILRVGWVYGARGSNFLLKMRDLMTEHHTLRIVADQLGAPSWCRMIAGITAPVIEASDEEGGVYNLAPTGTTSWYGFAEAIRDEFRMTCELKPIATSDYPASAYRPPNSVLDTGKIKRTFGVELPEWRELLRDCSREMALATGESLE